MKRRIALFSVLLLNLGGCAVSAPQDKAGTSTVLNERDPAYQKLVAISETVRNRWMVNDRTADARYGQMDVPVIDMKRVSPALRRVTAFPGGITIEIEPFVKKMAELSGYEFLEPMGVKPRTPILVTFPDRFFTLLEFITHAGYQAVHRADVNIDMASHTLQLVYAGAAQ